MTSDSGTASHDQNGAQGGAGGLAPFKQMESSRGVRQRRLERMVAKAKLKLARETAEHAGGDSVACLDTLRAGLLATDSSGLSIGAGDGDAEMSRPADFRERRQSATAILHHHREVVKLADTTTPAPAPAGDTHYHVHHAPQSDGDRVVWLEDFTKARAELDAGGQPETNGHAKNGSE